MFGVIASSSGCRGPNHSHSSSGSSSNSNKHQSNHDNHQRSQDTKEKSSHHKDKESSSKKQGGYSINQAIGASMSSMSCMGGSQQFVREMGVKAAVGPKT